MAEKEKMSPSKRRKKKKGIIIIVIVSILIIAGIIAAFSFMGKDETAETIVPDYCPDIARVIETDGRVFIHSREIKDGKAEVSGTVRVTVLYTPEREVGVRSLEFSLPFTVGTPRRSPHWAS